MKKLTAIALGAALAPAAVAISAAPAQASDCASSYPPGAAFQLRISPSYAAVNRNATIVLSTRLVRGQEECGPGERIGFWTRGKGLTTFALSRANSGDSRGLTSASFGVRNDFRWYTNHNRSNSEAARSSVGLVQVRPGT